MSASNWARCPRCKARALAAAQKRAAELQASYGNVSPEEYSAALTALTTLPNPARLPETFREDYEITGAETGVVKVSYGGSCETCGLSLTFDSEHEIPGVDE